MKVSPLAQGGNPGTTLGTVEVGRTANPDKLAAAKAIAAGETPQPKVEEVDAQVQRIQDGRRRIKMKTNRSPDRFVEEAAQAVAKEPVEAPVPEESVKEDNSVQAEATIEDTKPLSPQFAALAKQRRALQIKEREVADREKALEADPSRVDGAALVARLKSQPLSVLQEHGVTYDQLTEAILSEGSGDNQKIQALEAKIKALEEGVDQKFTSREAQAEEAALTEMLYEAEGLAKEGDDFEMIRSGGEEALDQVLRHIHSTYKKTGRVLDVSDAMTTIETKLLDEAVRQASANKVKSRLAPAPQTPLQHQQSKGIKTLTSRDNASSPMSAKARAIAAFNGVLRK